MHPMATKCCYTSIIMWQLLLRRKPEWAEKCSHVGMSWHENTFSITCLMYGECAGHRWSPSERVEYKVGTLNYFPFDFYQVISLLLLWYITTAKGRVLEYITLWCSQRRVPYQSLSLYCEYQNSNQAQCIHVNFPNSKVDGPHNGPMNFAIWVMRLTVHIDSK